MLNFIIVFYLICVAVNIFISNKLAQKTSKNMWHYIKYCICLFSGPILMFFVLFVYIKSEINKFLFKKAIQKEIERQIPEILDKLNINIK